MTFYFEAITFNDQFQPVAGSLPSPSSLLDRARWSAPSIYGQDKQARSPTLLPQLAQWKQSTLQLTSSWPAQHDSNVRPTA